MENTAPLPQWSVYAIMFGQAFLYTVMVYLLGRSKGKTADAFISGGRDIGHGMINASIIATWIWAATLMISSWTGFSYGFAGPWWYGLGATIPLPMMAYICRRCRVDMPNHRSYPEYMYFRLDRKNQICQAVITIIVCAWVTLMLVTGGGVMLVAFTGANFYIVCFVMVAIFVSYISVAGLWASIFADTVMALVMYICIFICTATVVFGWAAGAGLGGYWEGLYNAMLSHPVLQPKLSEAVWQAQWDGLNWLNAAGLGFLIVNTIGNLGAVMCNQTYWSRGIGSDNPRNIFKSFWTGAWCWYPIPLAMTTALGLGALAKGLVVGQVYFCPLNNVAITFTEATAAAPVMAFLSVGYLGLGAFVIAVTGATVSTGAGEILSTASVFANDIYKGWLKPKASSHEIIRVNRIMLYIIAAALLGIAWWWRAIGFSFSGMYQAMGVAFSSAVVPMWMAIFYSKTNR
ncbi:hypothetical protein CSA57_00035, partial [candidate division KSB3 bacterium]